MDKHCWRCMNTLKWSAARVESMGAMECVYERYVRDVGGPCENLNNSVISSKDANVRINIRLEKKLFFSFHKQGTAELQIKCKPGKFVAPMT